MITEANVQCMNHMNRQRTGFFKSPSNQQKSLSRLHRHASFSYYYYYYCHYYYYYYLINSNNEHILLITMLTIKIILSIKKTFRQNTIYNSFRLKKHSLVFIRKNSFNWKQGNSPCLSLHVSTFWSNLLLPFKIFSPSS